MGKQVRKDLLIQRTGRKLFRELLLKHLKVAQQQYFTQITLIWFTNRILKTKRKSPDCIDTRCKKDGRRDILKLLAAALDRPNGYQLFSLISCKLQFKLPKLISFFLHKT